MNTLHLHPSDVLFFRDGRPMEDGASGHGAAWPMPHVLNAAFHAALHRADLPDVHEHRSGRSRNRENSTRDQKFGSLVTVGPFPVDENGQWFFPRPADAQVVGEPEPSLFPLAKGADASSLGTKFFPVVNSRPPSKTTVEPWMNGAAWQSYLGGQPSADSKFVEDDQISLAEHQIGIAINPDTDTTIDGGFYSASYLRLQPEWKLGVLAEARDKINGKASDTRDLIQKLFEKENHLIVGGQQRLCSTELLNHDVCPLPRAPKFSGHRVKWTLLSPAVFPLIGDHPGGSLPSWVDKDSYQVQLLDGPGKNKARRKNLPKGKRIEAKLVAAAIPRALPVTGWALPGGSADDYGAKSTHLAVPAGTVYYFETESEPAAQKLAAALNWHGDTDGNTIVNRRSTLFGEKGFGLGVCSPWQAYENSK